MMAVQTTIGQRIRQKRKEFRWTQQELAKKLKDVSHVAISQWESNTTKPNAENLYELSLLLKCDFGWLLKGEGQESNIIQIENDDNIKIPILTTEQLQQLDITNNTPPISHIGEFIMTSGPVSEATFAFKVIDDSMKPDFLSGDIVIMDALQRPNPGEFVIARVDNEILFRKFQVESYRDGKTESFSLSPLNNDFPTLSSAKNRIVILGTMVEHRIYRRKR